MPYEAPRLPPKSITHNRVAVKGSRLSGQDEDQRGVLYRTLEMLVLLPFFVSDPDARESVARKVRAKKPTWRPSAWCPAQSASQACGLLGQTSSGSFCPEAFLQHDLWLYSVGRAHYRHTLSPRRSRRRTNSQHPLKWDDTGVVLQYSRPIRLCLYELLFTV